LESKNSKTAAVVIRASSLAAEEGAASGGVCDLAAVPRESQPNNTAASNVRVIFLINILLIKDNPPRSPS
jgi:hypothetical protein